MKSWYTVKCVDRVYKREFQQFSCAYYFTNTHAMTVVVRQNMCGVPAWTSIEISPALRQFGGSSERTSRQMSRTCVYREFQRFLGAYSITNTHVMAVVVRQNMCGVPAWTRTRDTSSIEAVWRKLRA